MTHRQSGAAAAISFLILAVLVAISTAACAPAPAPTAPPQPTPQVVEVPGPTVEVPVPYVPESCIAYMNDLQTALGSVLTGEPFTEAAYGYLTAEKEACMRDGALTDEAPADGQSS